VPRAFTFFAVSIHFVERRRRLAALLASGLVRLGTIPRGRIRLRALKSAGERHGPGTVAKALGDLTAAGELVNPKDKKGYRLSGWKRDRTPSLF
jgi:hypothetical protein